MPFVYQHNPLTLIGTPTVGEGDLKGECAAIAQFLVPGLGNFHVSSWRRGAKVKDNRSVRPGTVIAIFDFDYATRAEFVYACPYENEIGNAPLRLLFANPVERPE